MEAAIGFLEHRLEIAEARITFEIRTHDPVCRVGIVEAGEACDCIRIKPWPRFGHIETAVAGERGKEYAFEGKRRRFTARRDELHNRPLG
jgi:hypothetical protein